MTLYSGFLESAHGMPHRPALDVDGQTLTYADLLDQAQRLAATIQRRLKDASPLTAVFADRSVIGFAGILGALSTRHSVSLLHVESADDPPVEPALRHSLDVVRTVPAGTGVTRLRRLRRWSSSGSRARRPAHPGPRSTACRTRWRGC